MTDRRVCPARIISKVETHPASGDHETMYDVKDRIRLKRLDESAADAPCAVHRPVLAGEALTARRKQLIAVAVGLTPECPHCIELHTHAAPKGCNERASARQPKSVCIKERKE
jgi:AhpD family alkylhydroperoxidase